MTPHVKNKLYTRIATREGHVVQRRDYEGWPWIAYRRDERLRLSALCDDQGGVLEFRCEEFAREALKRPSLTVTEYLRGRRLEKK